MKPLTSIVFCSVFLAFAAHASAVTMNWSYVGNPGNPNDPSMHGFSIGSVSYTYNIGTYDVTNNQYAEFLNTKDPTGANSLGLWNTFMANAIVGGITLNAGNPDGNKYSLIAGNENYPVSSVLWFEAIRFANWLNNGQGNGDTETGAYTLLGGTPMPSNAHSITRNPGANVFLPSAFEWYKAAYYDPATSSYFQFPTSSNLLPIAGPPSPLPNHANYNNGAGTITSVGAYSGTTSPYGAFDMGGNIWQWTDTTTDGGFSRGIRGGTASSPATDLLARTRDTDLASLQPEGMGFRVAEIPEPSTLALAAFGFIGLAAWSWRRRMW